MAHDSRQCTHLCVSLIAGLWLEWIADETKHQRQQGQEDRDKITGLFARAVKDYLCMYFL